MIDENELNAVAAPALVTCRHVSALYVETNDGKVSLPPKACGEPANELTRHWCEPLCKKHYDWWKTRPPRTELLYADGHREMRRNFVYGDIYRDVETDFDGDTGNLLPKKTTWFERTDVYRDESGKVMLLFFREIPNPTPKQVKRANAIVKADTHKRPGRWRRFVTRVRVWFAMRGVG